MIIIIICLVGLICTSCFGIFLSSENSNNNITMSDCIKELNNEMDTRIINITKNHVYDYVEIVSNKADWPDILAVYTVKISNGNNENEVVTINADKKEILKDVFWDMNSISYEIISEEYRESDYLNILEKNNYNDLIQNNIKNILYIYINGKSVDEMKTFYNFNINQVIQLNELRDEKYSFLWNSVIYGNHSSSNITEWKQYNKSWANMQVGMNNLKMGDIGCLITAIAILVEKSNVSVNNIYPFNPGTFLQALNNNYGFDSNGNLKYSTISKVVPGFKYIGNINLREKTKCEKLSLIKQYLNSDYFIAVEVKGATPSNQHWVALDNILNDEILMLDPGSESTNMWKKYDWNKTSQFIYFKLAENN